MILSGTIVFPIHMSQYLRYVLNRAGAPSPRTIAVLKHEHGWVNRQIVDEFKDVFPEARVGLYDGIEEGREELMVLPFIGDFLSNVPEGVSLYHNFPWNRNAWVMLYRLDDRRIELLEARNVHRYYRQRWFLRAVQIAIYRVKLARVLRIAIRVWKRIKACAF
jgi:hypothetical protein